MHTHQHPADRCVINKVYGPLVNNALNNITVDMTGCHYCTNHNSRSCLLLPLIFSLWTNATTTTGGSTTTTSQLVPLDPTKCPAAEVLWETFALSLSELLCVLACLSCAYGHMRLSLLSLHNAR